METTSFFENNIYRLPDFLPVRQKEIIDYGVPQILDIAVLKRHITQGGAKLDAIVRCGVSCTNYRSAFLLLRAERACLGAPAPFHVHPSGSATLKIVGCGIQPPQQQQLDRRAELT